VATHPLRRNAPLANGMVPHSLRSTATIRDEHDCHVHRQCDGLRMKVRDLFRLLVADGWVLIGTRGSHRQFKHPVKPGLVTLAGSGNDDLSKGTFKSILKQAGLNVRDQE
jgi:predicted RNA binding protein YcfA (HicA-like mRNA interferase family)